MIRKNKIKILLLGSNLTRNERDYFDAVERAGGTGYSSKNSPCKSNLYDGMVVCGGKDIDPSLYGEENKGSINTDINFDKFELEVLDDFVKSKKPVFAICRGMQLVNVYFGGTLIQDLNTEHSHTNNEYSGVFHIVNAIDKSISNNIYGKTFMANSLHHQAVDKSGKDLIITSYSDDNVIESVEHKFLPLFAMQWHPERLCDYRFSECVDGNKIFDYFIELCKKYREKTDQIQK